MAILNQMQHTVTTIEVMMRCLTEDIMYNKHPVFIAKSCLNGQKTLNVFLELAYQKRSHHQILSQMLYIANHNFLIYHLSP